VEGSCALPGIRPHGSACGCLSVLRAIVGCGGGLVKLIV